MGVPPLMVVSRPWYRAEMAANPRELRGNSAGPSKTGEIRRLNGGAGEARTPDLRIANATLSQLSYGPTGARGDGNWEIGTWSPAYKSRPPGLPPCNSPPPGLGRADNGNIARACLARAWGDRPASCGRPASGVFRRESCIILDRRRSLFRRATGRIS